jgi:hypothetical protein
MFQDNLSVLSSRVLGSSEMGPIGCPETSVINYLYLLCNNSERSSFLIRRLKSPGIDHIPAVSIKAGGRTLRSETHKRINSICNKQELPEQWKEFIIVPLYETGDNKDWKLQRQITFAVRSTPFAEKNSVNHGF